jgi:hypothetical protein
MLVEQTPIRPALQRWEYNGSKDTVQPLNPGQPSRRTLEGNMAKGHSATKRKRRHKSGSRKDYTAATMAKLKQLDANAVERKRS